ncbi:alpha/beta hydrolase [Dyadobacter arcticus]|uniref:Alpha/beta hydrolase n=1 Tax=Dyadobacter arcticus TaxID=1078754 RepID=A0ABX0UIX9_9BACT|nr:alpha/beta hydrolase [Dyadobacter arcticus]NIJ52762.1 hypothetical protein [Dyadobacter arcticus]
MRGIVNQDLNERLQSPSVNASIARFYKKNDILEVTGAVRGDFFDDDNLWYTLDNGAFVWNGAVDVEPECNTPDPEDKEQFVISYRRVLSDGSADMFIKDPANELHFTPLKLPAKEATLQFNKLIPTHFADGVIQSVKKLKDQNRRHVVVYIHGFQPFSSLKLDLLTSYANNYMNFPGNKIAKVLFLVWPAQGLGRKRADDRAVLAGRNFTRNELFKPFEVLSQELRKEGMFLDLVVHSFGHQLLNGMLNPFDSLKLPKDVFENIFLMASDVTHLALNEKGFDLPNFFGRNDRFMYDYTQLKRLGRKVHVFFDEFDYLLYVSTKKFVGADRLAERPLERDRRGLTDNYRNLGNYGIGELKDIFKPQLGFNVQSVQTLIAPNDIANLCDFPWQPYETTSFFRRHIDNVALTADYGGFGLLDIVFNARRLQNYHKYVFTCRPVVRKVQSLLI